MQRAHEVLYYVGLGEARYRNVETYSTGMKQRIKLAQALVHDPDLLFLDEPTNGMDPKGRDEMLELVRDLAHNKGVNLILSSHLLPDVEYTCDHVVVLDKGAVATAGSIEQLEGAGRAACSKCASRARSPPFVAALTRRRLECHETDEDVMRVFVPGERAAPGEDQRRICEMARGDAACRSGTCARACRRSKTCSRGRSAKNEPDSRSELPPLRRAARSRSAAPGPSSRGPASAACSRARRSSALLLVAWIPFIVRTVQIYVVTMYPQAGAGAAGRRADVQQFVEQQGIFVFFVTIYVGAGLIANDRRANALQIYLSKPLLRMEYIGGKLAILVAFLLVHHAPAGAAADRACRCCSAGSLDFLRAQPVRHSGRDPGVPRPRARRRVVHDAGAVVALEEHALRRDSLHRRDLLHRGDVRRAARRHRIDARGLGVDHRQPRRSSPT